MEQDDPLQYIQDLIIARGVTMMGYLWKPTEATRGAEIQA